ncbi:hypothetical protein TCAL_15676 [Tigriopus californicus]|uniref:Uncharacterized protein n=1 Tax=Tigriopus californicus TaxID=6832 RepID=A0A553PA61_TIGCA|nr:hypothetical protein TCAL_15676 [Tigriopus californicus]
MECVSVPMPPVFYSFSASRNETGLAAQEAVRTPRGTLEPRTSAQELYFDHGKEYLARHVEFDLVPLGPRHQSDIL